MQKFSIRETAEILLPDRLGRTSYLLSLGVIGTMALLITLLILKLPTMVPLYFTLPWGEARLAPKSMLYSLPGIALGVMVFNLGLGRVSANLSPLLPRTLAVSTLVIGVMLLISLLGIFQSLL